MKNEKELGLYHIDEETRLKIDNMLLQNAINVANSGTGSRLDIGGESHVQQAWLYLQFEIRRLDPVFYNMIKSQDD
tara:strand:- start:27 stop:254 length:228 start_codon:yes stop_codon:yes gene_type:complete